MKRLFFIATILMTAGNANYNFDKSTMDVKRSTIYFPKMQTASIKSALEEMKSFSKAIGTHFNYSIEGKIKKNMFNFNGGTIADFIKKIETYNLFAETTYDGTLIIRARKHFEYKTDNILHPNKLKKILQKNKIYAHQDGKRLTIHATPEQKRLANEIVISYMEENEIQEHTYDVPKILASQTNKIKKEIKQVPNVKIKKLASGRLTIMSCKKDYEKVMRRIDSLAKLIKKKETIEKETIKPEEGEMRYTALPMESIDISLNKPYTLQTIVRDLSKKTGKPYNVNFDANIPVEKGVHIHNLEDLNKFLKRKKRVSLKEKKLKTGEILLVRGRK